MSAEGRNILEAVLNTNIAKKFNEVDESVNKLQDALKKAEGSANAFSEALQKLTNSVKSGDGINALIEKIAQASASMKNFGEVAQLPANAVAQSSRSMTDSVDKAVRAFNKLYSERLDLEKKLANITISKQSREMLGLDTTRESSLALKYGERIRQLNRELDTLKKKHGEVGDEAKKAYDIKKAELRISTEKKWSSAIDQTIKQLERLAIANSKAVEKSRNEQLGLTLKPQTIREYQIAIKNLQDQIKNMPVDDKAGIAKLNERITRYKREIDDATARTNRFREANLRLNSVLQQIAGAFGIYLGIYGLANFARNVAQVTGEFELQHRALQAIIGDMGEANKLWEKTVRLAVKSPYSVKDLVTYTKQLAAYRIETEKLYDTTKMLADISSGLGVDMQRLILAYGQVKAANYLRGQELRQFSEAGVNILKELANYFTELQGKAVTTAEVFEMVSKRMVKFEDVAEVLKRLTEEGGIFFNMQEIQAETLKGMMMNLKDSFDIMKNEIGESNRGIIVSFVKTAKYLADNWKDVKNVLLGIGGVIMGVVIAVKAMRIEMEATAFVTKGTAISLGGLSGVLARFRASMIGASAATRGFSAALKSIPVYGWIAAALSALIGIVSSITSKIRQSREEAEAFQKSTSELRARITDTKAYSDSVIRLTNERDNLLSVENRTEEQEKRLKEVEDKRKSIIQELIEINPSYGRSIDKIKDSVEELLKAEKEELETLNAILGVRKLLANEELKEAAEAFEKASDALDDAVGELETSRVDISNYIATVDEAGQVTSDFLNGFSYDVRKKLIDSGLWSELEKEVLNFTQNIDDMDSFEERYKQFAININRLRNQILTKQEYDEQGVNLGYLFNNKEQSAINRVIETVIGGMSRLGYEMQNTANKERELKEEFDKVTKGASQTRKFFSLQEEIDNATSDEEIQIARNKIIKFWIGVLDEEGFSGKQRAQMEKYIIDVYGSMFGFSELKIEGITGSLLDWQQRVNTAFDKIINDYNKRVKQWEKEAEKTAPQLTLFTITDPETTLEKAQKEILDTLKIVQAQIASYDVQGQVAITNQEYQLLKIQEDALKQQAQALGAVIKPKGGTGNKALELLNKQINAIKNAAKQYEEYKEMFDDVTAFKKTESAFEGLFKELNIDRLLGETGIFDKKTIQKSISTWLASEMAAAGKDGRIAIENYIKELGLSAEKANFKVVIDGLKKQMDKEFAKYDMYKELEKLGIGKDFARILFGVDTNDIEQLRKKLEEERDKLIGVEGDAYYGSEAQKAIEEMEKKIDDIEDKEQKDRLKKYIQYMEQAMSERVRIETSGIREIAEIEETFNKEIEKARDANNESRVKELESLKETALQGSKDATEQNRQKQIWKDFKQSDMYTDLFNDIDTTSTKVIGAIMDKLQNLKTSLGQLDPSDLKAIVQEMNKLESELIDRNPFKNMLKYYKEVQDMRRGGVTEESLSASYVSENEKLENLEHERDMYQELLYVRQQMSEEEIKASGLDIQSFNAQNQEIRNIISLKNQEINTTKKGIIGIQQQLQSFKNLRKAAQTYANQWKSMTSSIKSAVDTVLDNLDAFGAETNNTTEAWSDLLGSILDIMGVIPLYVAGMTAAGIAVNSAMGIIGLIAEAIQLVITLVSALAKMDDAAAQDQIDGIQKKIDHLSDAYDRLKEKFDEAWDVSRLREYRKELEENIKRQISDYNAMIAVEKTRKTPDKDQMYEWEQAKLDLQEDMKELSDDFKKEMGGIGASEYKDAAQEFVDAWADAFLETGDGLEGLKEHFEEVLQNLVKKQAMQRIASNYLNNLFGMIDSAIGDEGIVTPEEINDIREEFDRIAPLMNQAFQAIFNSLGLFGDQAESELSGLQKGIQGVTEETAEILAAYLNSIRYYIIDTNTKLGELVAVMQDTTGAFNPMLNELRNIKQRADDIYNFLFTRRENGTDSLRVYIVN